MSETSDLELPRLRLILALAIAISCAVALDQSPALQTLVLPLQQLTAAATYAVIHAVDLPVAIDGIVLTHPSGFRVAISYGCTPVVSAIFIVLLLTLGLRLNWRERLTGLASGLVLLSLLNLFRVTALYTIGVVAPGGFPVAHEWFGQAFIVIGSAAIVFYWLGVSVRSRPVIPAGVGS